LRLGGAALEHVSSLTVARSSKTDGPRGVASTQETCTERSRGNPLSRGGSDDADIDVTSQAELDAIATLTGLTEDDLVSLCIVLTKRLVAAERHSGPGTYDDPTPDDNGRIDEGGEG
jgi:hypothetical protein